MKRVQMLLGVSNRADAARTFLAARAHQLFDLGVYGTVGLAALEDQLSLGAGAETSGGADTLINRRPFTQRVL